MRGRELQLGLIVGVLVVAGIGGAVLWSADAPTSPDREEDVSSADPPTGGESDPGPEEEPSARDGRSTGEDEGEDEADDGTTPAEEEEASGPEESGGTDPSVASGRMRMAVARRAGDDAEGGPDLHGRVMLRPGRSAGGFEVQVEGVPEARTTTDESGEFRIDEVPEGHHVVVAHRSSDGAHGLTRVEVTERGGAMATIQVGTAEGAIEGTVLHRGQPVEGATVRYASTGMNRGRTGGQVTGPDGRYRFVALEAGGYRVEATNGDELLSEPTTVDLAEGGTVRVDLVLREGATIEGTLVATGGEPVEGYQVWARTTRGGAGSRLRRSNRSAEEGRFRVGGLRAGTAAKVASVDDDGSFRVSGLEPGGYRVIWTRMDENDEGRPPGTPGGMPARMEMTSVNLEAGEEKRVEIVVEQGITLSGRVLEAGRPVPEAMMQFMDTGGGSMPRMTRTDGEGRYEVAGLHPGTWRVMVAPGGRPGQGRMLTVEVPDRPEVAMDIEVPTRGLAGRVVDAGGEPLEGATVFILEGGRGGTRSMNDLMERMAAQDRTGGDGTFVVEGLGAGPFQVQVTADGFAPALVENLTSWRNASPSDGQAVQVSLEEGAPVTVRATTPAGEPVPAAQVFLVDVESGELHFAPSNNTNPEGILEQDGVRPGRYHIYVYADGWAETRVLDRSIRGHDEIRVVMEEAGTLEVRCLGPGGRPVDGAKVTLHYPDGSEAYAVFDMEAFLGGARRTGGDGRIVRNGLAEEPYTLRVEGPDGRTAEAEVEVTAGQVAEVEITLP